MWSLYIYVQRSFLSPSKIAWQRKLIELICTVHMYDWYALVCDAAGRFATYSSHIHKHTIRNCSISLPILYTNSNLNMQTRARRLQTKHTHGRQMLKLPNPSINFHMFWTNRGNIDNIDIGFIECIFFYAKKNSLSWGPTTTTTWRNM